MGWVSLIEDVKGNKAKEKGEIITCIGFTSYPRGELLELAVELM